MATKAGFSSGQPHVIPIPADVFLDSAEATRRRAEKARALNTRNIPRLRLFGFTLIAFVGVPLTNLVLSDNWSFASFLAYAIFALLYASVSWLLLLQFYGKTPFDLGEAFLMLDLIPMTAAVYVTGGENSWLFWLPLMRVVDQSAGGFQRALRFSALVLLSYALLCVALAIFEPPLDLAAAAVRIGFLAAACWYTSLMARAAEALRNKTVGAVRFAKELITELNEKTGELEAATARAEQASRAKSEFLARVSHELRRPATTIVGFAQLLEMANLTARQMDYVHRIIRGGRDLASLIDEVMDLAEVQSGAIQLSVEPVPFDDVLEEVMSIMWPIAADRGVRLVRIGEESTGEIVLSDRRALKRVLLNLLNHLLRFSAADDRVSVWAENAGDRLKVYVQDSGPGILPEPVEDLLSSHFSPDQELQRLQDMGLGLAFARALAIAMGGGLGADAVVGRATTYWIDLPLAPQLSTATARA